MDYVTIILLGISLSFDAFSLASIYGLLNIKNDKIILTSLIVGLFHFFMPMLGLKLGNLLQNYLNINIKIFILMLLFFLFIEMLKTNNKQENEEDLSYLKIIIFAFLVSIDSFFTGIGLLLFDINIYIISTIFFTISGISTFLGFKLGKIVSNKVMEKSKYIGITIILLLIVYILCK